MRIVVWVLLLLILGLFVYRQTRPPRHLHVWIGDRLTDVVSQWPEKLDRTLQPAPYNYWTVSDALFLGPYQFSLTIAIPEMPIDIPSSRLASLSMVGGRIDLFSMCLTDHAESAEDAVHTATHAIHELYNRGWVSTHGSTAEQMDKSVMDWIRGGKIESDKMRWNLKKPNAPDIQLETTYYPDRKKFVTEYTFSNQDFSDRLIKARERAGYPDSTVFDQLLDLDAYSNAVDRELAKERH